MTQTEAQGLVNQYLEIGRKLYFDEGNPGEVNQVDEGAAEMLEFAKSLRARPAEEQRLFFIEMYGTCEGSFPTMPSDAEMVSEMVDRFYDFYPRFDGTHCPSFDHLLVWKEA